MQDKPPQRVVPGESPRPIVVCPLEFERKTLQKLGLDAICDLHCCGPGAKAVTAWARTFDAQTQPVILAGLAGALDPQLQSGSARVITAVLDCNGHPIRPSSFDSGIQNSIDECAIISTPASVTSPSDKREMYQRTGARLVDLESQAFATLAARSGWRWLIVRGVSDSARESLPPNIDTWVDERGRVRAGVVAWSLLANPRLLERMRRLHRDGSKALVGVAALIRRIAE